MCAVAVRKFTSSTSFTIPRSAVFAPCQYHRFPVPLDKCNKGSGDEIAMDRGAKQMRMRHLRPSRRSLARKSRLEQQIPNERSIVEEGRYFVDFLHDFQSFSFQRLFMYLVPDTYLQHKHNSYGRYFG